MFPLVHCTSLLFGDFGSEVVGICQHVLVVGQVDLRERLVAQQDQRTKVDSEINVTLVPMNFAQCLHNAILHQSGIQQDIFLLQYAVFTLCSLSKTWSLHPARCVNQRKGVVFETDRRAIVLDKIKSLNRTALSNYLAKKALDAEKRFLHVSHCATSDDEG